MKSKEQIKSDLTLIATNKGYSGESTELIIDLLTYTLYHNQVEITNAVMEKSLSTASLINSKIVSCMDVMYSVYRGDNARVRLRFKNNTLIKKNKFELIFESNTFKLYTPNAINLSPSTLDSSGNYEPIDLELLFDSNTKYRIEAQITDDNKYYIDVKYNGHIIGNVSENVKVTINDVEIPTTRNFYDHINEMDGISRIFILTIPDYGIRLFKKGYFDVSSTVIIECLTYTTASEINTSEFDKILIPGTELIPFVDGVDKGRILVDEVSRDNSSSVLYNANLYSRLQSQILSGSDINALFTEYFITDILSAVNQYVDPNLNIFYVPRITGYEIPSDSISDFKTRYGSYFITQNINALKGELFYVSVSLTVYTDSNDEILSDVTLIFDGYKDTLSTPNQDYSELVNPDPMYDMFNSNLNYKELFSTIAKLNKVYYVESFFYSMYESEDGTIRIPNSANDPDFKLPTAYFDSTLQLWIPIYYEFTININYKNRYEVIS